MAVFCHSFQSHCDISTFWPNTSKFDSAYYKIKTHDKQPPFFAHLSVCLYPETFLNMFLSISSCKMCTPYNSLTDFSIKCYYLNMYITKITRSCWKFNIIIFLELLYQLLYNDELGKPMGHLFINHNFHGLNQKPHIYI